jgi:quercetin dioxygenase-like cupin family protein/alkylhydroperoxidase/carboxymuconolactone decarboxylase family protein YurZ
MILTGISVNVNAQNNMLSKKQEKTITISAFTARGDLEKLKLELVGGLEAGLTVNEIKEVLVHLYAYCGFPRSLRGLQTFMAVLDERKAAGISDNWGREASPITDTRNKYERGKEILAKLSGVTPPQGRATAGYAGFSPEIETFLKEHLFADIFERDILTFAERELATISALTAMDGVEPMRLSHINIGKNLGLTEAHIEEVTSIVNASRSTIFPKGAIASADLFNGTAYVNMLVPRNETGHYSIGDVVFEPGCRNNWHSHSAGQILLVTEGRGFYQERGKAARHLTKGDVVVIPSGVQHWHGATRDSRFVHLGITGIGGNPEAGGWFEPVSDEDYDKAHQ